MVGQNIEALQSRLRFTCGAWASFEIACVKQDYILLFDPVAVWEQIIVWLFCVLVPTCT